MTYIWDTNILLNAVRDDYFLDKLSEKYEFSNPHNQIFASIVTIGEIHAIALRNRWGEKRMANLAQKLKLVKTISIEDDPALIKMYAEIDVYSQSQHPTNCPHLPEKWAKMICGLPQQRRFTTRLCCQSTLISRIWMVCFSPLKKLLLKKDPSV